MVASKAGDLVGNIDAVDDGHSVSLKIEKSELERFKSRSKNLYGISN
jgi:hypothetical protein